MFGRLFKRETGGRSFDEIAAMLDGERVGGMAVTTETALQVSTVLACVDVIASGIAVPELHAMRSLGNGQKEKAEDEDIYRLLHRRPNEWQTSFEFRETLTSHAALAGDGYAVIARDPRNGQVTELLPLMPQMVTLQRMSRYDLRYVIADEFGAVASLPRADVLHIRNRSWDRISGMSAVHYAGKAIGLAIAAEDNLAKLNINGGRPGGVLSTEQALSPEAIDRIKAGFQALTRGAGRYNTAILDSGFKYQAIGMSAVDTETLNTRRQQVEEICRAFGVLPIMVGHADKTATYASAEAFFSAHNRKTVMRWQRNWAEVLDEFVLDAGGPLFVEFDNQEVRSANIRDQAEFFARALGSGGSPAFMTVNEVRADRGLPPIEGGDKLPEPVAAQNNSEGTSDDPSDTRANGNADWPAHGGNSAGSQGGDQSRPI